MRPSVHFAPPAARAGAITAAQFSAAFAPMWSGGVKGVQVDFTDPSLLATTEAGTTPVSADGDQIGYATDLSGNGLHLTQTTAASRGAWRNSGGFKYWQLDGNDWLQNTSTDLDFTGAFTIVIGCLTTVTSGVAILLGKFTHGATNVGYDLIYQDGIPRMIVRGTSNIDTGNAGFSSIANLRKTLIVRCSPTSVVRKLGTSSSTTTGTWTATASAQPFSLGRRGNSGATPWVGNIYRAIVIGKALSATEEAWAAAWCHAGGANQ